MTKTTLVEWVLARINSDASEGEEHCVLIAVDDARRFNKFADAWPGTIYEKSRCRLTWAPTSERPWGAVATLFSGYRPEHCQGAQAHSLAIDESTEPRDWDDFFNTVLPAVRLGKDPQWKTWARVTP